MSYDATIGRWMETDPAQYDDSMNLYEAFDDNPATLTDPTGMAPLPIINPIGGGAAATPPADDAKSWLIVWNGDTYAKSSISVQTSGLKGNCPSAKFQMKIVREPLTRKFIQRWNEQQIKGTPNNGHAKVKPADGGEEMDMDNPSMKMMMTNGYGGATDDLAAFVGRDFRSVDGKLVDTTKDNPLLTKGWSALDKETPGDAVDSVVGSILSDPLTITLCNSPAKASGVEL